MFWHFKVKSNIWCLSVSSWGFRVFTQGGDQPWLSSTKVSVRGRGYLIHTPPTFSYTLKQHHIRHKRPRNVALLKSQNASLPGSKRDRIHHMYVHVRNLTELSAFSNFYFHEFSVNLQIKKKKKSVGRPTVCHSKPNTDISGTMSHTVHIGVYWSLNSHRISNCVQTPTAD